RGRRWRGEGGADALGGYGASTGRYIRRSANLHGHGARSGIAGSSANLGSLVNPGTCEGSPAAPGERLWPARVGAVAPGVFRDGVEDLVGDSEGGFIGVN